MPDERTLIPSASRLFGSLRDIGYDLPAAVADLADNSLDADASTVEIDLAHRGERSWLRIADDGMGMTESELDEAMRLGSSRAYSGTDLGKYGLGLKTASLSQCRALTVATRTTRRGPIRIRRWDLDEIALHDAWRLQRLTPSECPVELTEPLATSVGTVVLWEKLDRILAYRRPDGDAARLRMDGLAVDVANHLGVVFHRFLAARAQRPLRISVNGRRVEPWDPFATSERLTRRLPRQSVVFSHEGLMHRVAVRPFVLPNQQQFSSVEAHAAAAGPHRWNRQQGLYIYRRERLIQSGGWNRLRTMDEHSKLARIALDIPPRADGAFRINVSKMTVGLPDELRAQLRTLIAGVVGVAQDVYRQRTPNSIDPPANGSGDYAAPAGRDDWTLGDRWTVINRILHRHLHDRPELLDRLLLDLVNRPELVVHSVRGADSVDSRPTGAPEAIP